MARTPTEKEATYTNARSSGTQDTDIVGLQCLIDVIPDHPSSNDGRLRHAVILDAHKAVHRYEHAHCRTESRIRSMTAALDLHRCD